MNDMIEYFYSAADLGHITAFRYISTNKYDTLNRWMDWIDANAPGNIVDGKISLKNYVYLCVEEQQEPRFIFTSAIIST